MAALMSSGPGPDHSSGGVTSPRPQTHHSASAMRSPTNEQQSRPHRTVRVQQPPAEQEQQPAQLRPVINSRSGNAGGGSGGSTSQQTRSRQQAPTSQPQQSTAQNAHSTRSVRSDNPQPERRESTSRSSNAPASNTRNSSFPHAFERWEMLSSRWEGLTGYWISKLEQNRHELAQLPLEQQMSRQITDLSAAGANLFHAVVELQRLRASSERKFQRWFFETRADQERSREMSSELEATLRVERQKRADAMAVVTRLEKEKATAEKLVEEFRRELQISREECRRSWEELGRREQEERERRNSLREGNPTLVGDYQVLPMPMPGVPSRGGSSAQRPQTSGGYSDGRSETHTPHRHQQEQQHMAQNQGSPNVVPGQTTSRHGSRSPIAYPPSQQQQQRPGTSSSQQPFYQHAENPGIDNSTTPIPEERPYSPGQESFVTNEDAPNQPEYNPDYGAVSPDYDAPTRRSRRPDSVTETDMSDEEAINTVPGAHGDFGGGGLAVEYQRDERGALMLDSRGDPIILSYRHSRIDPDDAVYPDYDGSSWGAPVPAPVPPQQQQQQQQGQYGPGGGGQGYGSGGYSYGTGTGWEGITRHHHPTRLSDVVEEEERTHSSGSVKSRK